MNCLDFRRLKLAVPRELSHAAREHLERCSKCKAFGESVDQSDDQLRQALQVATPDGLADRIIARRRHSVPPQRWARLALAAGLLLAVASGLQHWRVTRAIDQADLAIRHVLEEPPSTAHARAGDSVALADAVARLGGQLTTPLGEVQHFSICFVGDRLGWHVVLRTPVGTATVLLLPGRTFYARGEASHQGWAAISEAAGEGSLIVIAQSHQTAAEVTALIKERIRWQS